VTLACQLLTNERHGVESSRSPFRLMILSMMIPSSPGPRTSALSGISVRPQAGRFFFLVAARGHILLPVRLYAVQSQLPTVRTFREHHSRRPVRNGAICHWLRRDFWWSKSDRQEEAGSRKEKGFRKEKEAHSAQQKPLTGAIELIELAISGKVSYDPAASVLNGRIPPWYGT